MPDLTCSSLAGDVEHLLHMRHRPQIVVPAKMHPMERVSYLP